ncbi:PD-(D/E)XK nuclease family protein [Mucilaginibacter calamicampi]|uniref:PD-(D/E)XK nuclease family protein n=1 Tax=Mucilaginibacter calamicampi TaxID=1302352 RepID=A0ABW2YXQ1_9SPHI
MEQHHFKSLLSQVTTLNNHYIKINELTGENFNVFRILKLDSSEVRMHSAFIAELLNPQGSHGQHDIFLRLFIREFCFKANGFDSSNCHSDVELHTAFISQDGSEGGRIDIIVTDCNHNKIIIENKIYAGDLKSTACKIL